MNRSHGNCEQHTLGLIGVLELLCQPLKNRNTMLKALLFLNMLRNFSFTVVVNEKCANFLKIEVDVISWQVM